MGGRDGRVIVAVPSDTTIVFEDEVVQDEFGGAFHLACCFMQDIAIVVWA